MNFYQDFIVAWGRLLDLFKFQNIGRTIVVIDDCFHEPHSYDDISLFVSFIDIPVSLGSLFQRIAPINDRFNLPVSIAAL